MANPYKTEIAQLKATTKQHTGNIRYFKDRRRQLITQARQPNCIGQQALRDEAAKCQNDAIALRRHARHALLAYGLLRGRSYQRIENSTKNRPSVGLIQYFLPENGEEDWQDDPLTMKVHIPKRIIETWLSGGCMSLLECMEAHGLLDTSKAA